MLEFIAACVIAGGLSILLNLWLLPRVEKERW